MKLKCRKECRIRKKVSMYKILHISKNKIIFMGNKFSGVLFRVIALNASDVGFKCLVVHSLVDLFTYLI